MHSENNIKKGNKNKKYYFNQDKILPDHLIPGLKSSLLYWSPCVKGNIAQIEVFSSSLSFIIIIS